MNLYFVKTVKGDKVVGLAVGEGVVGNGVVFTEDK